MGKVFYLILLLFCALSCKSQKASSLQIIQDKIGPEAVISYNESEEFALVKQYIQNPQTNFYSSKYLILEVRDNSIIHEGHITNGYVKWIDNDTVEIFENPGVIKESDKKEDFKRHIKISEIREKKK